MPEPIACRLCGSEFVPHRGGPMRYCPPCRERAAGEATRVLLVSCKGCGSEFSTPSRVVRYCSDPCRKKGRRRRPGAAKQPPGAERDRTRAVCRVCTREFAPDRGPGKPRAYCSDGCRAEGRRALSREAMRRYRADPEKRAIQAMRKSAAAAAARRAAAEKGGGG